MDLLLKIIRDYLFIAFGACAVAVSIELILAPNELVGGGVFSLAIIISFITDISLWIPILLLNTLMAAYSLLYFHPEFILKTAFGILCMTGAMFYFQGASAVTDSDVLILIYGGVILGTGIGLVIKGGGALGIEMLAMVFAKRFNIRISAFLLTVNGITLLILVWMISLEKAMFSVALLYVSSKTIDFVIDGSRHERSLFIISRIPEKVSSALIEELNLRLTYLYGQGGYTKENRKIIYCITNRVLYNRVCALVSDIDPKAIIEANYVYETIGTEAQKLPSKKHLKKGK
ncbi:YitT family protein [Chitinivibrio alkaliphilus]|uniref:DUF2179 domain-containing protein n=1 Tax=Chitinivibrio alkaliphilus ACht1 TaxID=1313304 RepID=U7D4D7_9BACT|nr:YitT family protein [Chitinivibrio alkaliphilus]ERP31349.1 hypothetical protein CALK_1694 [Chitinivibrio alkaliphilus ACht1]